MATDRMNTIQDALKTKLDADSAITNVFKLVKDGLPMISDPTEWKVYDHEYPAVLFEVYGCDDLLPDTTMTQVVYERQFGIMFVLHSEATVYEIKERLKECVSQLRDWLHSTTWTYYYQTRLEQSGFEIAQGGRGFLGVATIPFTVDLKTG